MAEKKTVFRWWWVWNFEKEEQWLNEMAMDGWVLCGVGFAVYHFERMENNDYTVHIEMRSNCDDYLRFMEELGAEYVGRVAGWVYYRQRKSVGGVVSGGDIDLRIAQLRRIAKMLLAVGMANIFIGVANSINASHMGFINLLCGCLLMYALGRIRGKEEELKKERVLHE